MLNIPDEVKKLFKSDSVKKNFRVHFPGGEYRDLVNADIVADSVSFTESVCSKTVLQFGLAEASRIEFECVGVPNIYGATIECYCEIDATSLDAEYQTVKSDVPYPVYAIPYGVFRVQSCPRSAGAMSHRRVEAYYADNKQDGVYSSLLTQKLALPFTEDKLIQNAFLLVAQELNTLDGLTYTESTENFSTSSQIARTVTWSNGTDSYVASIPALNGYMHTYTNWQYECSSFTCDFDTSEINAIYAQMSDYGALPSVVASVKRLIEPHVILNDSGSLVFDNPADTGIFYPYYAGGLITKLVDFRYADLTGKTITISKNGSVVNSYTLTQTPTNCVLKRYTLAVGTDRDLMIALKGTTNEDGTISFSDSLDLIALIEGCAELKASFRTAGRDGVSKNVRLSKSTPVSITPTEYSDMWWDEYTVAPIGTIQFSYYDVDAGQESIYVYEFSQGESVYDMANNYVLKNIGVGSAYFGIPTAQEIRAVLRANFIPYITDIAFTPVDLSAIGLPYLEAGDYLEIDAGDGTTVGTYILSRTLNGEQYLTDDIQSQGGEIIGSTVRSV